ncbi:MAG: hypothetical protein H3C51_01365 [Rubellimicrobium sp.]|nr:hypothetical protein [Rubellimicrobium sp.]
MSNSPFRMMERDLDLVILEELYSDTGFARWFAEKAGLGEASFRDARHSVFSIANGRRGETDVLANFDTSSGVTVVLVEDKIAAQFADKQADRYQERAKDIIESGDASQSVVLLVAPRGYLSGVPKDDPWDMRLAIEDLVEWFDSYGNFRGKWRAESLRECLAGVSFNASADKKVVYEFARNLSDYLSVDGGGFSHRPTGDKWGFSLEWRGRPSDVLLQWKNGKGKVDLTFQGKRFGDASGVQPPAGIRKWETEKSEVFSIDVSTAYYDVPFDEQTDVIDQVIDAAHRLTSIALQVVGS